MQDINENITKRKGSSPRRRVRFDGEDPETFSKIDEQLKLINADCEDYKEFVSLRRNNKMPIPPPSPSKYKSLQSKMGKSVNTIALRELNKLMKPKSKKKKEKPKSVKNPHRVRILPCYQDGPYNLPEKIPKETCNFYDHMNVPNATYPKKYYDEFSWSDDEEENNVRLTEPSLSLHNTLKYGTPDGSIQ